MLPVCSRVRPERPRCRALNVKVPAFRYALLVSKTPFNVVIAEDEALIRLDLREMLEEEGYVVAGEAGDGETAVKLAEELRPDLVIMDVKMPGLDGISAAERITANLVSPVIILTAFSQRDLVQRASEAGAMAYLSSRSPRPTWSRRSRSPPAGSPRSRP